MKLENLNDQMMATAAHRYCLGRSTYIVGSCCEWIRETWAQINSQTQAVMLRDTLEALHDARAGMDCDVHDWTLAARWMWENMTDFQRTWVRSAVEWKTKDIDALFCKGEGKRQ